MRIARLPPARKLPNFFKEPPSLPPFIDFLYPLSRCWHMHNILKFLEKTWSTYSSIAKILRKFWANKGKSSLSEVHLPRAPEWSDWYGDCHTSLKSDVTIRVLTHQFFRATKKISMTNKENSNSYSASTFISRHTLLTPLPARLYTFSAATVNPPSLARKVWIFWPQHWFKLLSAPLPVTFFVVDFDERWGCKSFLKYPIFSHPDFDKKIYLLIRYYTSSGIKIFWRITQA